MEVFRGINPDMEGPIDPGNAVRFSQSITGVSTSEQWGIPPGLDFRVRRRNM